MGVATSRNRCRRIRRTSSNHNNNKLPLAIAMLLCAANRCWGLLPLPFSLPPLRQSLQVPPSPVAPITTIIQQRQQQQREVALSPPSSISFPRMRDDAASAPAPASTTTTTMLLAAAAPTSKINNELSVQTQAQQMRDAMVLKTMRGTQWRVIEEQRSPSYFGKDSPRTCKSLATFSGFVSDTNKGTVTVEYMCGNGSNDGNSDDTDGSTTAAPKSRSSSGRWVTKPSRLARGSIQLSPRWKVKLPRDMSSSITSTSETTTTTTTTKTVIYKGFIDAEKMIGRSGKSVSAEMVGVILTGEEVNKEKVIGRFTADFVRQLDPEEIDAIKIGGGSSSSSSSSSSAGAGAAAAAGEQTQTRINTSSSSNSGGAAPIITLSPK